MRRFELHRDEDETGFSGTGVVAEGVAFGQGVVALHWHDWPSTVVVHSEGIKGVIAVHGHDGRTRLVWLDEDIGDEGRYNTEGV